MGKHVSWTRSSLINQSYSSIGTHARRSYLEVAVFGARLQGNAPGAAHDELVGVGVKLGGQTAHVAHLVGHRNLPEVRGGHL